MASPAESVRDQAPRWRGELALAFTRESERTAVARQRVCMPLAMQRPFYPEGPETCHVLMLHPPGGMVGGDRLDIAFDLNDRAQALVSTPSAAKWYRGKTSAYQAAVHRLAAGSRLEWLPQETIVFDGARVEQTLRVELAAGATWLGWEITRFGRSARGETFRRGAWRMATEVWRGRLPLWIDRQRLDGGSRLLQSAYGLHGAPVIGTLAWIGHGVPPELVDTARLRWDAIGAEGDAGVTRLEEGLLCRYRGPSSATARAWFTAVWELVREHDRQRPACAPRVWNT